MNKKENEKEEKMKKNFKAQAWSMDIIIGVVLFLIILVALYALVDTSSFNFRLRGDADKVYSKFDKSVSGDALAFIDGDKITKEGLEELLSADYETLKREIGITSDFCIIITDQHGAVRNMSEIADLIGYPMTYGAGADLQISMLNNLACGD